MNKKKIIDALYVIIFVVGIVLLIYFMATVSFWYLLAGIATWSLMPILDKAVKKINLNNDKEVSE